MTAVAPAPVQPVRAGAGAADDRLLPVLPALAPLFGAGGLRRGSVVAVRGSASLLLALLAGPSRDGAWCAVVGLPSLGLVAAGEAGVALDRLALVPDPGRDWAAVAAALLDAVDVVVVAPRGQGVGGMRGRVLDGDVRRLAARARQRRAVLVPYEAVAWPGVDLRLSVASWEWEGLDEGSGHLRARRAVVRGEGRGAAARARELRLWLPAPGGGVEPDTTPVTPLRAVPAGTGPRIPAAAGASHPLHAVPDQPSRPAPRTRPAPAAEGARVAPRPPDRTDPAPRPLRVVGDEGPGAAGPSRPPVGPLRDGGPSRRSTPQQPGRSRPVPTAPDPAASRPGRSRPADGRRRPSEPDPERPPAPTGGTTRPADAEPRRPEVRVRTGGARRFGAAAPAGAASGPRPAGDPVPAGRSSPDAGAGSRPRSAAWTEGAAPRPGPSGTAARSDGPAVRVDGTGWSGGGRPGIPTEVLARLRPASSLPRPPRPATAEGRR